MSRALDGFLKTVTVRRSWIAQTVTGATALVLETKERETTAFVLSLQTIEILRKELAKAELALRRTPGNA